MEIISIVAGVIGAVVVWRVWAGFRSRPFTRMQVRFTRLVDALEAGDIEQVTMCERIFNEISGDALRHLSLQQLVRQRYIREKDAVRIHALHELQGE